MHEYPSEINRSKENFGFINLEDVYRKAESELAEYRVSITEFVPIYGSDTIERDCKIVDDLKHKFETQNSVELKGAKKFATIFENTLNTQAELSDWFGAETFITPASEYDDFVNGVDMIVEVEQESAVSSHLGLAIDVTFANDLDRKILKIKNGIEKGKMAEIKYFQSNNGDFTRRLSNIPRVIIAADKDTITGLTDLHNARKGAELGNHWIQFQMLEQLMVQLDYFEEYAEKCGKNVILKKLKSINALISRIYDERTEAVVDTGERDKSSENLEKRLKEIFG